MDGFDPMPETCRVQAPLLRRRSAVLAPDSAPWCSESCVGGPSEGPYPRSWPPNATQLQSGFSRQSRPGPKVSRLHVNVVFAAQTVNDLGSKFTGYMVLDSTRHANATVVAGTGSPTTTTFSTGTTSRSSRPMSATSSSSGRVTP